MVQHLLFANNASSRCHLAIAASDTSIALEPNEGGKFPVTSPGDTFMVTLEDRRSGQIEICECTQRSGDLLTVLRGQEGTIAQAFAAGTTISNRLTAATLTLLMSSTGVAEAPINGKIYGRKDATWIESIARTEFTPLVGRVTVLEADMDVVEAKNVAQDAELLRLENIKVDEAPIGLIYGRQGEAWVETISKATYDFGITTQDARDDAQDAAIAAGVASALPDAPSDGSAYGRRNAAWTKVVTEVTYTAKMSSLDASIASLTGQVASHTSSITDLYAIKINEAPINGQQYVRQDAAWQPVAVPPGTVISDTPPSGPVAGQLWWESDTGNTFIYYQDGDSGQWVQFNVGNPQGDYINSVPVDMWAGFKTGGKFVINDKVDGTGTDVLTMFDTGAMTVTGDINGGNNGYFGNNVRSGPATGTRSLLVPGGLQLYNDATYPLLISNLAGTGYMTIGSSGVFNVVGGTFAFQGAGTSRMTINSSGYVNITPPAIVSYGLDVRARTDYSAIIGFLGNTSYYGIVGNSTGAGYSFYGNVGAYLAGGTWATSDIRAKTGMRALDPMTALDKVKAIGTYLFTFKMDGTAQYGFSAQEVREFIPEAVRDVDIPDHDTVQREAIGAPKSGDATIMAINDRNLLATLWAAVQALSARVEELEAR